MTAMFELLKRKLADAESSSEEEEPTPATPAEPDVDTEAVSSPANAKEAPETVVGDEDEDEEMLL